MTGDPLYDLALVAALGVISKLEAKPDMPRQEKLATVTYGVLDAIREAVDRVRASGSMLPVPADDAAVTVRCRLVVPGELREPGRRNRSPALPPPR
jgi:hypothetical protein